MKKTAALILAVIAILAVFSSCGTKTDAPAKPPKQTPKQVITSAPETESPEPSSQQTDKPLSKDVTYYVDGAENETYMELYSLTVGTETFADIGIYLQPGYFEVSQFDGGYCVFPTGEDSSSAFLDLFFVEGATAGKLGKVVFDDYGSGFATEDFGDQQFDFCMARVLNAFNDEGDRYVAYLFDAGTGVVAAVVKTGEGKTDENGSILSASAKTLFLR